MSEHFLKAICPLVSRELIYPWRLASLVAGLALLIAGSFWFPSEDWDIPICLVMGVPAYVFSPWAFRQIWYLRWKWWPLAALAFWFTVDATYSVYWWCRGFPALQEFRPANFFYCTPIFWISGFFWNLDLKGLRICPTMPLTDDGEALERRMSTGFRLVLVVFCILLLTRVVAFLAGLQRFVLGGN